MSTQHEVKVEVGGEAFVGHYEVQPFSRGGHSIVVFYRGKKASDRIPPEVNERTYVETLAASLLEGLVGEESSGAKA